MCFYPLYIDKDVSREKGRKVGLQYSVEKPRVEFMAQALQMNGYRAIIESNKRCVKVLLEVYLVVASCVPKRQWPPLPLVLLWVMPARTRGRDRSVPHMT